MGRVLPWAQVPTQVAVGRNAARLHEFGYSKKDGRPLLAPVEKKFGMRKKHLPLTCTDILSDTMIPVEVLPE